MTSVVVFIMVAYSITFLIADASIFGCGTSAYKEDPNDAEYIWSKGIFKIRPYFLQVHFFRELFSCYFCLGIWTGSVAHTLLYYAVGEQRYWFYHPNTQHRWLLGFALTSLLSSAGCYFVDTLIDRLASDPPPTFMETYSGNSENDHGHHEPSAL